MDDCLTRILANRKVAVLWYCLWMTAKPAILREELPRLQQRGFQRVRLTVKYYDSMNRI